MSDAPFFGRFLLNGDGSCHWAWKVLVFDFNKFDMGLFIAIL